MSRGSALVTGGTGALGRVVVGRLLAEDIPVTAPWIIKAEREQLGDLFSQELASGALELLEADVAETAGAQASVAAAASLGIVLNLAGGFAGGSPVHETELETWDQLYRMNLRTAVAICRAALPRLLGRGAGAIVNVASQATRQPPGGLAAYAASKAGVVVLTETLQKEVAHTGIRVNAVSPSTIDTPANRAAMPDADFSTWTPPERIADVILWLTSDAASPVRGAILPV